MPPNSFGGGVVGAFRCKKKINYISNKVRVISEGCHGTSFRGGKAGAFYLNTEKIKRGINE